jgi:enoyl-CoA hydratase/carnithine racemase
MTDHVLVSQSGGVCELRLNRPEKRNAITLAMYDTLWDAMVRAEADDSIRVILLSGAGASFTAGNDLSDFLSGPPLGDDHSAARFVRLLPKIHKVLIAAVHGSTVGIGVTLLLHCDLVLVARSARLSMPFVKLGLVPEAASSLLLPRLVGHQRAAELLLLGTPIDSATAFNIGLANRVVEDDTLLEEARTLARTVAEQPAGALRATKQLLRSESGTTARIEEELRAFQERLASAEFKSAAQAFFSKGHPG